MWCKLMFVRLYKNVRRVRTYRHSYNPLKLTPFARADAGGERTRVLRSPRNRSVASSFNITSLDFLFPAPTGRTIHHTLFCTPWVAAVVEVGEARNSSRRIKDLSVSLGTFNVQAALEGGCLATAGPTWDKSARLVESTCESRTAPQALH